MADEPIWSFEVLPVPRAGFIGRLFSWVPRAAAFVEVRNLLATTPYEQVRASDVTAALARVKLDCRRAVAELAVIFEHAVLLAALDRSLTEADRRGLLVLQHAFQLTDAEAATAIESAVGMIYERALREALLDNTFTDAERTRLTATATTLGMLPAQITRLFDAVAAAAVQATFASAVADRRLSEAEDAQIAALTSALCDEIRAEPGDVALAWLVQQPGVTAPIIGPRTLAQLEAALRAVEMQLSAEVLAKLYLIFPGYKPSPEDYAW